MQKDEERERQVAKKKTLASLKKLTAPPPPEEANESESDLAPAEEANESDSDLSEMEQDVTTMILSTLPFKKKPEDSGEKKGPQTRSRKNNK